MLVLDMYRSVFCGHTFCLQWNKIRPWRPKSSRNAECKNLYTLRLFRMSGSTFCFTVVFLECKRFRRPGNRNVCSSRKRAWEGIHPLSRFRIYETRRRFKYVELIPQMKTRKNMTQKQMTSAIRGVMIWASSDDVSMLFDGIHALSSFILCIPFSVSSVL